MTKFFLNQLGYRDYEAIIDQRPDEQQAFNRGLARDVKALERFKAELLQSLADVQDRKRPEEFVEPLKGKTLPDIGEIGLSQVLNSYTNRSLLVVFFDVEQRPSRYLLKQLAQWAGQLKNGGISVVVIQAAKLDGNRPEAWTKENDIPFPMGKINAHVEKYRFAWGVKSLPWLILADKEHIVRAEGFGMRELNRNIQMMDNQK